MRWFRALSASLSFGVAAFLGVAASLGVTVLAVPAWGQDAVYLFYTEPPFPYRVVEQVEVELEAGWSRDEAEAAVRAAAAEAGGEIAIVADARAPVPRREKEYRLHERWDGAPADEVLRPGTTVTVRAAERLGKGGTAEGESAATFPHEAGAVWRAAMEVVHNRGWVLSEANEDSRFLVTRQVVASGPVMRCSASDSNWQPVHFLVFFLPAEGATTVHLEAYFPGTEEGRDPRCVSVGVYEKIFFQELGEALP